jgi:hypothetical protein
MLFSFLLFILVSEGVLGKILKLKDIVPWGHYGALRKLQLRDTPCKICKIGPRPQEYCDEAIAMGLRVRLQETDDIETPLVGHRRTFSKHDSNMLAGPLTTGSLTSGPSIPVKSSVSDTAQDRKRSEPIARTPQRVNKKGGQSTCLQHLPCIICVPVWDCSHLVICLGLLYYLIYAGVNVIISLPGLYGYAQLFSTTQRFHRTWMRSPNLSYSRPASINWVFYSLAVCHLPLEQSKMPAW